jgi:hypothetical protein
MNNTPSRGDAMTDASSFTNLVPGFDFLQGLVKNAGAALPVIGQWVAPTLDPAELEKRIDELRTVQFWLEQNARMLGATIQALEVQRMTLSTLKTSTVQMAGLRDALHIRMPGATARESDAPAPAPAPSPAPAPAPAPAPTVDSPTPPAEAAAAADATPSPTPAPGAIDPMQWWGALTKQFTELATTAMKDTAADAARKLSGAMAAPPSDSADPRPKTSAAPAKPARKAAKAKPKAAARKKAAPNN